MAGHKGESPASGCKDHRQPQLGLATDLPPGTGTQTKAQALHSREHSTTLTLLSLKLYLTGGIRELFSHSLASSIPFARGGWDASTGPTTASAGSPGSLLGHFQIEGTHYGL